MFPHWYFAPKEIELLSPDMSAPSLTIDRAAGYDVTWVPSDSPGFVNVEVGSSADGSFFNCYFDPEEGEGHVSASVLSSLPAGQGRIVILVESLESDREGSVLIKAVLGGRALQNGTLAVHTGETILL